MYDIDPDFDAHGNPRHVPAMVEALLAWNPDLPTHVPRRGLWEVHLTAGDLEDCRQARDILVSAGGTVVEESRLSLGVTDGSAMVRVTRWATGPEYALATSELLIGLEREITAGARISSLHDCLPLAASLADAFVLLAEAIERSDAFAERAREEFARRAAAQVEPIVARGAFGSPLVSVEPAAPTLAVLLTDELERLPTIDFDAAIFGARHGTYALVALERPLLVAAALALA